jgi:hypothetical protein
MGQAFLEISGRESESGAARIRTAIPASIPNDPIPHVSEAVESVLKDLRPRSPVRKDPGCHVFVGKLLSVRQTEALPPGTRSVQVDCSVVITPLAQDLLKRRGITIRVGSHAESRKTGGPSGEWGFAIESEQGTTAALRRALLDDLHPWSELPAELTNVTEWLVEAAGRGAVWVTDEAALTVWKSCQVNGVRAAAATEPAEVHRAARTLGPNLLVFEPAGKSISWMKQLTSAFRMAGPPASPETLMAGGKA